MVKDAEDNAEQDKQLKSKIEARNEADSLIYATEKSMKDYGDKITDDDRKNIEGAIEALRGVMDGDDVEAIKSKTEELKQASYKLAEEVYKTQQEQGAGAAETSDGDGGAQGGSGGGASASGDNVEDVDYEVVDDDEKS